MNNDFITPEKFKAEKMLCEVFSVMEEKNFSMQEVCNELGFNPDDMRDRLWRKRSLCAFAEQLQVDYLTNQISAMQAVVDTEQDIDKAWLRVSILMYLTDRRISSEMAAA